MIPFNRMPRTGNELKYILEHYKSTCCLSKKFTVQCQEWFEKNLSCKKALLTPSCTHALEMTAILSDIRPGDEVIMPSFTFVSTANAFVLRGAKIKFVDIRPDTLNIDEKLIEAAITPKTKAIVAMHYAGVACEMDEIMKIAEKHDLMVIEDAAQCMLASYKERALGTIGHFGTYSFHETKNFSSGGEGGVLLVNDETYIDRAEIIREKGTNRSLFFKGLVDKYTWVDVGGNYMMSEMQAAYLWGQLESAELIDTKRHKIWSLYFESFKEMNEEGIFEIPKIPEECRHNAHIFYIKTKNLEERTALIEYLRRQDIYAVFHYVPLHTSPAGMRFGTFVGEDNYTTKESERLVRLPLFHDLNEEDQQKVIAAVKEFFKKKRNRT